MNKFLVPFALAAVIVLVITVPPARANYIDANGNIISDVGGGNYVDGNGNIVSYVGNGNYVSNGTIISDVGNGNYVSNGHIISYVGNGNYVNNGQIISYVGNGNHADTNSNINSNVGTGPTWPPEDEGLYVTDWRSNASPLPPPDLPCQNRTRMLHGV